MAVLPKDLYWMVSEKPGHFILSNVRLQTRNSRDAVPFPGVDMAGLPKVSVQSSQRAASSNPAISSVASPLTPTQLSPECLAAIVQVVKASMQAEPTPVSLLQPSSLSTSVAVVGTSCPSLPVLGVV